MGRAYFPIDGTLVVSSVITSAHTNFWTFRACAQVTARTVWPNLEACVSRLGMESDKVRLT